jgi:hypothetical protein
MGGARLLVAPVAVPAGLALGGLRWAWQIYAITAGLAGQTASAPVCASEGLGRWQPPAFGNISLHMLPKTDPSLAKPRLAGSARR